VPGTLFFGACLDIQRAEGRRFLDVFLDIVPTRGRRPWVRPWILCVHNYAVLWCVIICSACTGTLFFGPSLDIARAQDRGLGASLGIVRAQVRDFLVRPLINCLLRDAVFWPAPG
jgi:hypothetical protein